MSFNTRWFNRHGVPLGKPRPKPPPKEELEAEWFGTFWLPLLCGLVVWWLTADFSSGFCCFFFPFIFSFIEGFQKRHKLRLQVYPESFALATTSEAAKKEAKTVGREYCLHIDKSSGKKCKRMTYRSTEHCYMHQPK